MKAHTRNFAQDTEPYVWHYMKLIHFQKFATAKMAPAFGYVIFHTIKQNMRKKLWMK